MSIKASTLAFIALSSSSSLVLANNYQYEVSGNYDYYNSNNAEFKTKDGLYNLTGTYYFSNVETKNHPLAQAAFMERVDNVSLHYLYNTSTYDEVYDSTQYKTDQDTHALTAMVRMWWFDKFLYTSVGVTEREDKFTTHSYNQNGQLIHTGKSEFHDHTRMQASLGVSPFAGVLIYTSFFEGTNWGDANNLNLQYARALGNNNAIATHIRYIKWGDNPSIVVEADYYFTPRFSVGVGYEKAEDYNNDYDWMARSRYFITPKVSLDAYYKDYEVGDAIAFGATARF